MEKISRYIFQIAIGVLFGYFGAWALVNPDLEAAKWLSLNTESMITILMPVKMFMLILGSVQILVAVLLVANKFIHVALPLAALLLLGIIINLGWNEIALRDFVILLGVGYLYFSSRAVQNKNS